MKLAAREHRFEQIGGIHGAFRGSRADHGVQLVDEENDLALGFLHLFEHGLEALFEFAAIFGAGDERAHIERDDSFILQTLGHVAAQHALRQPLDDRGLAHAGVADQHRVVFAPPREHLDHAPNFFIAADDRIELALSGKLGEIAAIFSQRFIRRFGILRGHALVAANIFERARQLFARDAKFFEDASGRAAESSVIASRSVLWKCSRL